ncbi:Uncharacterised protein [Actinobacillus pleuropneumoniae]|nr:Uncharacterised protein [Actinobacillus pleuropneumoniae]
MVNQLTIRAARTISLHSFPMRGSGLPGLSLEYGGFYAYRLGLGNRISGKIKLAVFRIHVKQYQVIPVPIGNDEEFPSGMSVK